MDQQAKIKALELLTRFEAFAAAGNLSAAESALDEALRVAPENLECLYAAARFYSRALPKPERARDYATACRKTAAAIGAEMDEILGKGKALSSRHIGGIIGPY